MSLDMLGSAVVSSGMTAGVLPSSMSDCVSSPHPSIHHGMSMYQSPTGMMSPHSLPHHHPHHPHAPPMPLSDADTDPRELGNIRYYDLLTPSQNTTWFWLNIKPKYLKIKHRSLCREI